MGLFDQETTTTGSPWGPLQQPLLQGVEAMQAAFNAGPWGGPYTAGIDPRQLAGINAGAQAAGGAGDLANTYANYGSGLAPGLSQAYDYYSGALGGMSSPWMTNTDDYLGLAGQIADNPYLDSQITSALRDPYRNLTENTLPGNALNAAMLGQSGGSGRQVKDAIAERGYADRAADVGAQMRGGAWQQGLGIANQASGFGQNAQQNAAMQLAGLGGQGLGYLGQGYGWGQTGAQDQFNWGTAQQNLQNQQLEAQMRQFYEPWTLVSNYGNYINPLAQNLQTRSQETDLLGAFLGNIAGGLGDLGGDIGGDIWDWAQEKWF